MLRRHWPFLILLAAGFFLRVALMYCYFPGVMLFFDSPRYARSGGMPLFGDFWMPAGYPVFLLTLRTISNQLWITIAVQHGLGLATGLMVYLSARRLHLGRSAACLPAGAALLSGDHLYLEHSIMADSLLIFSVSAGLTAIVLWNGTSRRSVWLITASICLGVSILIRSVGVVLVPVLVFYLLLENYRSWRERSGALILATAPALLVLFVYSAARGMTGGQYLGIADMRGWNLYSRVAPFADCRTFQPPPGTTVLCEARKPIDRPGPFGYVWDAQSISRKNFDLTPKAGQPLLAFANAVILHQPGSYFHAVIIDLSRYLFPSIAGGRPYSGEPREILSFGWRDREVERMVTRAMGWNYHGVKVEVRKMNWLATYQDIVRVHGIILVAFLIFSVGGIYRSKGRQRTAIVLFGLSALGLYLLPVATVSYDFRYGIPPETFLVMCGTLGAAACLPRRTHPAKDELA